MNVSLTPCFSLFTRSCTKDFQPLRTTKKKNFSPGDIVKEDLSHVILIVEGSCVRSLWLPRCWSSVGDLGNNVFVSVCLRAALMGMNVTVADWNFRPLLSSVLYLISSHLSLFCVLCAVAPIYFPLTLSIYTPPPLSLSHPPSVLALISLSVILSWWLQSLISWAGIH